MNTEEDRIDRRWAIEEAVRSRASGETPEDVIEAAKAYYEFVRNDRGYDAERAA